MELVVAEGRGAGLQHSSPACGERDGHQHAGSQLGPASGGGRQLHLITPPPPKKKKGMPQASRRDWGAQSRPVLVPTSPTSSHLTLSLCLARGGCKTLELHVDVHLHPQEQSHLQQDQLELPDTWDRGERGELRAVTLILALPTAGGPQS